MNIIGAIIMGLFAGGFVATTGMLKDIRWEPFSMKKYLRSPIIALIWAIVSFYAFQANDLFILMGFCAGMERITVEIWKGMLRKKPSKFNNANRDTQWLVDSGQK